MDMVQENVDKKIMYRKLWKFIYIEYWSNFQHSILYSGILTTRLFVEWYMASWPSLEGSRQHSKIQAEVRGSPTKQDNRWIFRKFWQSHQNLGPQKVLIATNLIGASCKYLLHPYSTATNPIASCKYLLHPYSTAANLIGASCKYLLHPYSTATNLTVIGASCKYLLHPYSTATNLIGAYCKYLLHPYSTATNLIGAYCKYLLYPYSTATNPIASCKYLLHPYSTAANLIGASCKYLLHPYSTATNLIRA